MCHPHFVLMHEKKSLSLCTKLLAFLSIGLRAYAEFLLIADEFELLAGILASILDAAEKLNLSG